MKYLLILASVFMTVNAFAAATCDLNIAPEKITGAKETTVVFQDSYRGPHSKGQSAAEEVLKATLLATCKKAGAENCTITNLVSKSSNTGDYIGLYFGSWWLVTANATGTIKVGGTKLTESEYAKSRQKLICAKLNSCISDALNDAQSTTEFMEKLYLIKDKTNCNEVENFIF